MSDTEKLEMINEKLIEDLHTFHYDYVKGKDMLKNFALEIYLEEEIFPDIRKYSKKETASELIEHIKRIFRSDAERFAKHTGTKICINHYANKMLEFISEMDK